MLLELIVNKVVENLKEELDGDTTELEHHIIKELKGNPKHIGENIFKIAFRYLIS